MSNTALHPIVARFAAATQMFLPQISTDEIRQMNELVDQHPEATDLELNRLLTKEFNFEARHEARKKSETDIDEMTTDFKNVIEKWGMLKMLDPLVVAGSVIHYLEGISAVTGCFIEDLARRSEKEKSDKEEG